MSLGLFFLECLPFASAGQAWRTESCPLCRTLSPPPHPSSPPPPHLLPLPPPPADPPSPPRIDRPAGNPPQRSGVWRRRRRGGEGLARAEQVQPWAGGGAGYLSPGTKEGGGSEGERSDMKREIMSDGNAAQCPCQKYYFSDLPVSLILALTVWTKGLRLSYR